ncbi:MAG TPA: cupin domain-containing protein [Candidatus Methylomirabilis sp.]|nr:cupin domain-containing protein [Candidatus Methylomirabilis sp.]
MSYVRAEADVTTRLLVEAHLSLCASCTATVAEHQRMSGRLPDATLHDELDLPPFDRVWAAVQRTTVSRSCRGAAVLPPSLLAELPHPSGWRWVLLAWPARVTLTLLIRDVETRSELYLCHFTQGSTFPRHQHLGLEENVILAGGYRNGDVHVDLGDWVIGAPGTEETSRAEDSECWCLSRIERPGVRFTGWRSWIAPLFATD